MRARHARKIGSNQTLPHVSILKRLLAALLALSPGPEAWATVPLVQDGEPRFHLALDNETEGLNETVIADLKRVLNRITGAEVSSTPFEKSIPLYLGETNEFEDLPIDTPDLKEESFLLRVTPDAVFVIGGSPLGTSHGVYTLLNELGCRWVMPGEIGECLPDTKTLALEEQDRVEKPDFSFRVIWYAYGCSKEAGIRYQEWMRRNRMRRPPVQHGHNLTNTLDALTSFEERPELYSLNDGERTRSQICTSNPETVALVTKAIQQYLSRNPQMQAYSLCPDDNSDFCECDNCRALDVGHIDRGGRPSISDRYQVFLNQVLDGLKETHPNVLASHYAYNQNHTDTPRKVPVHPNTCIFLTTSVFCSAHGIGDPFCQSRMDFKQLLSEWTAKTEHVYIYEYDPVPYSGGLPWPMWEAHGREAAVYKEIGVKGLSFEGQNSWAAYFPNYYVGSQMMWDTDQDHREVYDDLMNSFFVEVAEEMKSYHDALASRIGKVKGRVEWGLIDYPKYFPPEVVEACRTSLERAEARATTPAVKERVEMVRMSFDQMDAYLGIHRADESTTWEEYKELVDGLEASIARMEKTNEDYLLADIAREKTSIGVSDRFAGEQGFMNRWWLCGPFENLGWVGHETAYPPEKGIDLSAVYEGKDGVEAKWRLNRTPEWKSLIDFRMEYDQTDWVCAYAACWVTLDEGPRDVLFRVGSNDSVQLFLNGEKIWDNKTDRVASVDDDLVPVTLPEGMSEILVKIGQTGRDWGFYFRITETGSQKVPDGLQVFTDKPG